ncbi:HpcH/HpaI aldolase/citrate lyase family protein [Streptomyces chartreusis]
MTDEIATARSFLFVPGDRPERFDKAVASGADVVLLDLEDAVAPEHKPAARDHVRAWLEAGNHAAVRINGTDTPWFDDDLAMVGGRAHTVMLPKAADPTTIGALARALPGGTGLIPLIETAVGVVGATAVCAAPGVIRPAFGSVDLAAELGVDPSSFEALSVARSALVLAAAATGRAAPIDGVTLALADDAVLHTDIDRAAAFGCTAKLCIHPRQVPAANDGFAPTLDDIAWARQITASAADGSVTVHDGQMIDRPVLLRAHNILSRVRSDRDRGA